MQTLCLHITWQTVWWFTILQTEETVNLASSHHLISWQHESAFCCDTTGERRLAWKSQIWWLPKYEPRSTTRRVDSGERLRGSRVGGRSAHKVTSLNPYLHVLSSTLIYYKRFDNDVLFTSICCGKIWRIPTTSACQLLFGFYRAAGTETGRCSEVWGTGTTGAAGGQHTGRAPLIRAPLSPGASYVLEPLPQVDSLHF